MEEGWGTQYLPELIIIGKCFLPFSPNLLNNSHKRSRIIFLKTIDMYDVSGKNHWIYGKAPCSSPRSAKNWGILRGFPITESITD